MNFFCTFFLVTTFFLGCSNDNEEDYFSNNDCNSENVNYLPTVRDIIESKCSDCHAQGNSSGLPLLNSYENINSDIDNIIYRINHPDNNLIMPPLGAIPLSDCEIMQIQNWYENEMPI